MPEMEWREIPGYEGLYAVNNFGAVKSLDRQTLAKDGETYSYRGKILSQHYKKDGYLSVGLRKNGISKSLLVHRLVALAFHENQENKETVNHIDGIKDNNNAANLEWASRSEQTKHAYSIGLKSRTDVTGKRNGRSKLDEDKVRELRKLRDEGVSVIELAKMFKVGVTTVSYAITGKSWSHVK